MTMNKLKPGMYLKLFHGFESDEARNEAENWGAQGPTIGPLLWSHQTYNAHITLGFPVYAKSLEDFLEGKKDIEIIRWDGRDLNNDRQYHTIWLNIKDDCIHFDGMFYGDWEFVYVE